MNTLRSHTNCITDTCVIKIMAWLPFELLFCLCQATVNGLLVALIDDLKNRKKFPGRSVAFLFHGNYNAYVDKILNFG